MAGSDRWLSRFLAESGMSPDHMAASAADPEFLAAVLDFFLSDDRALADLAEGPGIAPAEVAAARRRLPGGLLPHWT